MTALTVLQFFLVTFRARGDPHSRHEVRVGGTFETPSGQKEGISEKEVLLLSSIHGKDAVLVEKFAGTAEVELTAHYVHLAKKYGKITDPYYGIKRVEACFHINLGNIDADMAREVSASDHQTAQMRKLVEAADAERELAEAGTKPPKAVVPVADVDKAAGDGRVKVARGGKRPKARAAAPAS